MKVKEFELALKKGLGRCIYAIKENPSEYREVFEKSINKIKCIGIIYRISFFSVRTVNIILIISSGSG